MVSLFFLGLLVGCSGNENIPSPDPEPEKPWNKMRTVKITYLSDLTGDNPFTISNYPDVGSSIKGDDAHVVVIDRSNVTVGHTRIHPGARIAIAADRVPIFVPIASSETTYTGSTVLFKKTVQEMEQTIVIDGCRMLPIDVEITQSLKARTALLLFDRETQIAAASSLFRSAHTSSTLVTGTVKRDLIPELESLTSTFTEGSFTLKIMENSNKNSEYVIYLFGSSKWKFREFNEKTVTGPIKSFQLQVEIL